MTDTIFRGKLRQCYHKALDAYSTVKAVLEREAHKKALRERKKARTPEEATRREREHQCEREKTREREWGRRN